MIDRVSKNDLFTYLRCPVCGSMLHREGNSLFCEGARRHCYDVAKSGYVHLALQHTGAGDSREAVCARSAFLGAGYYRPAAEAILSALRDHVEGGFVIDAGCGEGYYSHMIAEAGYDLLGIDLSRPAIGTAAKRAGRDGVGEAYAVAGIFGLPVPDGSADAIVNVFAPCAEDEFLRVLKPGGYLILAGAGRDHLLGLKKALYEETYENPGRADLPVKMVRTETRHAAFEITVTGRDSIAALFSMTPYYWRTSPSDAAKLDVLETLTTSVDFEIGVYRKEG